MDVGHGALRRQAYAKLAALSTRKPVDEDGGSLQRLVALLPTKSASSNGVLDGVLKAIAPTSRERMSIRELDILLALCAAAAKLQDFAHAERAVAQLGDYLPEAHSQLFVPSPYLQEIRPSPWAVITRDLTRALLTLGIRFPSLKDAVQTKVQAYLSNWTAAATALATNVSNHTDDDANEEEAVEVTAIAVSMVAFLEAAAQHEQFWTPEQRLLVVRAVKDALSEKFLVTLETSVSTLRHTEWADPIARHWKGYLKNYAVQGSPLGAMLLQRSFMQFVLSCVSRFACADRQNSCQDLLDLYTSGRHLEHAHVEEIDDDAVESITDIATTQMNILEDGSDYLQLTSAWQQRLAFYVKSQALQAYILCMVLDEDIADAETLCGWLEDAIESQPQMTDLDLSRTILQGLAVVSRFLPDGASNIARVLLKYIVQGTSRPEAVIIAGHSLAHILRSLSDDAIITTLYSLGNVLSSSTGAEKPHQPFAMNDINGHHESISSANGGPTGSVLSFSMSGDEETSLVCGNVARAIVTVAKTANDSKIVALAQMLLAQKIGRINILVDAHIIEQTAILAVSGRENELRALVKLHSRLQEEAIRIKNAIIIDAVRNARIYLATNLPVDSSLYKVFALSILERILSKGDVLEGEFKQSAEVEHAAQEFAPLLPPLAIVASRRPIGNSETTPEERAEVEDLAREAWYNIAVHGVTLQSRLGQQYYHELRLLAMHSAPIISQDRAELLEADVEINTVLRRGMSSQHASDQKRNLLVVIPDQESHIRHLTYQKVVFLNAVYLVESLRAASGSCTGILAYFADPALKDSAMGSCLSAIASEIFRSYVQKARPAIDDDYAAPHVAKQLVKILEACCHRSAQKQQVARSAADYIINLIPSALIQKSSLFALLELLSLMWSSCLESETEEYEWRPTFISTRGKVLIELSDDYDFRKRTLNALYNSARKWVTAVIAIAPLDVKGLHGS